MAKDTLVYRGGGGMPETAEGQQQSMEAWGAWYGQLGVALVEGGAPFGVSASLDSDGSSNRAASGLSGYTIVSAESIEAASGLAQGCPVLGNGGAVDIYECIEMAP
jgi:hypothetical protein